MATEWPSAPACRECLGAKEIANTARTIAQHQRLRRTGLRLRWVRLCLKQPSKSLFDVGSKEASVAANLDTREQAAARVTFDRR